MKDFAENSPNQSTCSNEEELESEGNKLEWLALNEVVIGRGPSPFLSNLDLFINDLPITTVQGDGKNLKSST